MGSRSPAAFNARNRRAARHTAPSAPLSLPAPKDPAARAGRRVAMGAAAIVALAGYTWFGRTPPVADHAKTVSAQTIPVASGRAPAPTFAAPGPQTAANSEAPGLMDAVPAPMRRGPVTLATNPARTSAANRVSARAGVAPAPERPDLSTGVGPPAAAGSPGPLAEAGEVPPAQSAPPAPDRWQLMSDALSRCAAESALSGFICVQRVRLESCEGYWGRVSQCPNRPENPN